MKSQSVTAPSLTKKRYTFFTDVRRNRFSYLLILPALVCAGVQLPVLPLYDHRLQELQL